MTTEGSRIAAVSSWTLAHIEKLRAWRLFRRDSEALSDFQIIKWWELRRIPYNLVVGAAGFLSIAMAMAAATIAWIFFHFDYAIPDPPLFAFFAIILYGIMANVCYTGGWVAELAAGKIWGDKARGFGEISFTLGTAFSVGLSLLPGALLLILLPVAIVVGRDGRQLHEAITHGDEGQVRAALSHNPKTLEARTTDKFAATPLCDALDHQKWSIARILLEAGADIKPDCFGRPMISLAAASGDSVLIRELNEKGATAVPPK